MSKVTVRHSTEPPLACANSWPVRRRPSLAFDRACEELEAQAAKSAGWLTAQRRDGIVPPAETIVLDCLSALRAIPEADRMYADTLTDVIARGFLETAWGVRNHKRRAYALLRISGRSA